MWHPALLWLSARRQHCHCPPKAISLPMEVERVKLEVEMGEEGEIETKAEPDSQEEAKVTVSVRTTCAGITDRSVLRQKLMHLVDFYLEKFGGPVQFLQNTFDTPEAFEDFRKELFKLCPWMDCMDYVHPGALAGREKSLVHITMLDWDPQRSTKGLPFRKVARDLAEEYMVHGFLTEVEPLLLWTTAEQRQHSQHTFRPNFVKGMARSSTCLMLVAILVEEQVDVATMFPELYHSLHQIHAVFESHTDLGSVAIANAHHSNRGALRAPHDIITWVMKLRKLEGSFQPTAILERFNSSATQRGKITGNKRVSALALLQAPCREGLDKMIELLSEVGSKQVWWNEDTFCNKKLMPGYVARCKGKWNGILNVTEDSFAIWTESLNRQQLLKGAKARRPLDKSRLEEHSALSAFFVWAAQQALDQAVDKDELTKLGERFMDGDIALQLDLQTLLHERKNDIDFKDVRLGRKFPSSWIPCTFLNLILFLVYVHCSLVKEGLEGATSEEGDLY